MRRKSRAGCQHCGGQVGGTKSRFCDNRCQNEHQQQVYVERWKRGEETGLRGRFSLSSHIRRYLLENCNACPRCGWAEKHPISGKVPLTIDHVDGDWQNCREENLRVLCPNCHALTPNYGILNRGRGRTGRHKTISTGD